MPMKLIHIAYAEDHDLLRIATTNLLAGRGFIVNAFANGKELLDQLHIMDPLPDLCIINMNMPKLNGLETMYGIRKDFKKLKVLVYSLSNYDRDVLKMIRHGANGYLIKNGDIDQLYEAIISIYKYGFYVDEEIDTIVTRQLKRLREG
jgi:DNA-binding NarL/FixJ family response regulator